jgi:hypothetical protein
MALPERLFYTLDQASQKIGCTVDDLHHFALLGKLELCVPFEFKQKYYNYSVKEFDDFPPHFGLSCFFDFSNEERSELMEFWHSNDNKNNSFDISFEFGFLEAFDVKIRQDGGRFSLHEGFVVEAKAILALPAFIIPISYYQFKKKGLSVDRFYCPRNTFLTVNGKKSNKPFEFSIFVDNEIKYLFNEILITKNELNLLQQGGENVVIRNNLEQKTIRIQSPERILNQILLKENFSEMYEESKSSQLADTLNYLAQKHGFNGNEFNKQTISGWLKRYKNPN